jgi:hypothetical protein
MPWIITAIVTCGQDGRYRRKFRGPIAQEKYQWCRFSEKKHGRVWRSTRILTLLIGPILISEDKNASLDVHFGLFVPGHALLRRRDCIFGDDERRTRDTAKYQHSDR